MKKREASTSNGNAHFRFKLPIAAGQDTRKKQTLKHQNFGNEQKTTTEHRSLISSWVASSRNLEPGTTWIEPGYRKKEKGLFAKFLQWKRKPKISRFFFLETKRDRKLVFCKFDAKTGSLLFSWDKVNSYSHECCWLLLHLLGKSSSVLASWGGSQNSVRCLDALSKSITSCKITGRLCYHTLESWSKEKMSVNCLSWSSSSLVVFPCRASFRVTDNSRETLRFFVSHINKAHHLTTYKWAELLIHEQTVCGTTSASIMAKVPTVLVTGASGYIATHIVQQLLQAGEYQVGLCSTAHAVFVGVWLKRTVHVLMRCIVLSPCQLNFCVTKIDCKFVAGGYDGKFWPKLSALLF